MFTWQVQNAFYAGKAAEGEFPYRPEILKAFADKDGIIDLPQAVYDTPEKIALVKGLLQKYSGIADPELRIEVVPWAMTHGIVGKKQAIRDCVACHAKKQHACPPGGSELVAAHRSAGHLSRQETATS